MITSVMFGISAWVHLNIFNGNFGRNSHVPDWMNLLMVILLPATTYLIIIQTIRLATRLTAWEAAYRGYRLPHPVVLRALYYHAAHSLPVATIALTTVAGYAVLLSHGVFGYASMLNYLYVLCGEVLVAAFYLFATYWIAMRNLMYANR